MKSAVQGGVVIGLLMAWAIWLNAPDFTDFSIDGSRVGGVLVFCGAICGMWLGGFLGAFLLILIPFRQKVREDDPTGTGGVARQTMISKDIDERFDL
jgi:hypothetical protein